MRSRFESAGEFDSWLRLLRAHAAAFTARSVLVHEGPLLYRHPKRLEAGFAAAHALLTAGGYLLVYATPEQAARGARRIQTAAATPGAEEPQAPAVDTLADGAFVLWLIHDGWSVYYLRSFFL